MIRISAALVVAAIALLVYGAFTANLPFVYAAIGVSVLAMILLGLGVFLQRDLLWGSGRGPAAGERAGEPGEEPESVAAASTARPGAGSTATGSPDPGSAPGPGSTAVSERTPEPARPSAQAAAGTGEPGRGDGRERHPSGVPQDEADAGELVHVLPGRRRYHRAGCASLAGRVSEELTIEEAREEGFTACTVCFPAELAAEPAAGTRSEAAAEPAELDTPVSRTPLSTGSGGAAETASAEPTADAEPSTDTQPSAAAAAGLARATEGGEHTAPGGPGKPARASGETVWVVRGVSRYHRSDCVLIRSVDEEDVDTMTQADAEAADCTPCRACHAVDEPLAG